MDVPHSIREINDLADHRKHSIYQLLLPDWLFSTYGVNTPIGITEEKEIVSFRCPRGSRAVEITVRRHPADIDPVLYLNMADTFNNQLLVLLVVVNDPDSQRFDIDIDENGTTTNLGTTKRNLRAEEAAMQAGLAPGQIRRGLRSFKQTIPIFEAFVKKMGHDMFLIEPLAYHNAIIFERYGFNYVRGRQEMIHIHQEFQPNGEIHGKLSATNVFRQPESWRSIRGRSWAIHDGILDHPFTGFQMYKRIGSHAGVNTFPNADW